MTKGQEIAAKDFVRDLGSSYPSFYLICHHATSPDEVLTGENLRVSYVYSSAPHLEGKVMTYEYEDEARPTVSQFYRALLFLSGMKNKLHVEPEDDVEDLFATGGFFNAAINHATLDRQFVTAVKSPEMLMAYADTTYSDWDKLSKPVQNWLARIGFRGEDGADEFIEKVWFPLQSYWATVPH
ncbi:hypothetical protein [uncultured Boseongicola sp.]|uniref:hypothetical protein n=1 Tax=uncultured Boseongicola sp. TaxID=1648499 RepID=UPI00262D24CD|nr:hypothetical protein [uncultured Boseongicola sp.]